MRHLSMDLSDLTTEPIQKRTQELIEGADTVADKSTDRNSKIKLFFRMVNKFFGISLSKVCLIALGMVCFLVTSAQSQRPNVLFISIDDLNDWSMGENASMKMPNLDRLASNGVQFTRAYTVSPACNPSRVALLTGQQPFKTGVYGNFSDWQRVMPDVVTLPEYFKNNDYESIGAGKIFHHIRQGAFHDDDAFDRYFPFYSDSLPENKLNRLEGYVDEEGKFHEVSPTLDWGPVPYPEEKMLDVNSVDFATEFLREEHDRPFFLAVGLWRPHFPYFAPARYFSEYSGEDVPFPPILADDLEDVATGGKALLNEWKGIFETIKQGEAEYPGTWKKAITAYHASATFADDQVGRLLDALETSPYSDNTVIVVWSDHGYHLGEKEHWTKFALWERTTHVPLIIAGPGLPEGVKREQPVSLIDLYPALVELAGLPAPNGLDGRSLLPLLKDPDAQWNRPAIMTYLKDNYAVRSKRWRYIRYADGSEELYDMKNDPNEWHNVADNPELGSVIRELVQWLPEESAPAAPDLGQRTY